MIYKVEVDLKDVLSELKRHKINSQDKPTTFVFVPAADPDEACVVAVEKICNRILAERDGQKIRSLLKEIKPKIRIIKLRKISPHV